MENMEEIRAKADELLKQEKYTDSLPLYEQAAEMGDVYSATKAATIGSVLAKLDITLFGDFLEAEKKAAQALHWYEEFKDIDSPLIAIFFDRDSFIRNLGFCYYRLAVHKRGNEDEMDFLCECFSLLCEVVDSSDEFPDAQALWALTVQRMQDLDWDWDDCGSVIVDRKNELFNELIGTNRDALLEGEHTGSLLSKIYVDYGFVLLEGTEVAADHTKAYHCFKNAFAMGIQSAEGILRKFAETTPGKYTFVG